MRCPKCGHENNNNTQYCVKCGTSFHNGKKRITKPSNRKFIIAIIILLILLIIATGFIFTSGSSQSHDTIISTEATSDEIQVNETSVMIDGVNFIVPNNGDFRRENEYYFEFNNHSCAIKEVTHYETTNETRSIDKTTFGTDYPGAENYISNTSNRIWNGIKIQKDDKWFHIGMRSYNNRDALVLLDWIYDKNTWEGHR